MPFIPHTREDVDHMLKKLGVARVEDLFDEIPSALRIDALPESVPAQVSEQTVTRLMRERARQDTPGLCFLGAGAYDHFIPAAVWEIVTRGEFYSAYTPYQAEASQGTLQVIYEFQSMMTELTGLEVSNASLYDGASALAEAILMACRIQNQKGGGSVALLPEALHPAYRRVIETILEPQSIGTETIPYDQKSGLLDRSWAEERLARGGVGSLVLAQPNFFGLLDAVDSWTDLAHRAGLTVIALVNPTSLAILNPPGKWGTEGADIVCGEGQPLGVPLSSGGPYFGFLTSRKSLVRQMPGRIVGRTLDRDGRPGFTLTLQAREQHIRRARAMSNICTNQGLLVTAATLYLSFLGPTGLARVARACHARTRLLVESLTSLPGVRPVFPGTPFFHEYPLAMDRPARPVLEALSDQGILGGYDLGKLSPELSHAWLLCATEARSPEDIACYRSILENLLSSARPEPARVSTHPN
ncbi:MAG: aminomethyl-transferring glycine dehydrogenase subunit GcvPA [Gammaproteobacteria bacterium]